MTEDLKERTKKDARNHGAILVGLILDAVRTADLSRINPLNQVWSNITFLQYSRLLLKIATIILLSRSMLLATSIALLFKR